MRQPLTSLPVSSQPNFRVHLDLLGPLQSSTPNSYILVISDSFSKYIVTVPLPDKTTKTVAEAFFQNWVLKFSPPISVLSDRGGEFNSDLFRQLNTLLGTEVYKTAGMHPASNSQCERWNRTFERIITSLLLQHQKSSIHWEQLLQIATYSYNISIHKSSQYSPFFLTYLHPPNEISFDVIKDAPITSWPEDILHSLSQIYDDVQKNLTEALPPQTGSFRSFNVGDRVLVSFPKQLSANKERPKGNPKFLPHFEPNYTIVRKLSPSAFHVKRPYGRPLVVNADRLKLDTSPAPPSHCRPITRSMAQKVDHVSFVHRPKPHMVTFDLDLTSSRSPSPTSSSSSDNFFGQGTWGTPQRSPTIPPKPASPSPPSVHLVPSKPAQKPAAAGTKPAPLRKKRAPKSPAPLTSPVRAALARGLAKHKAKQSPGPRDPPAKSVKPVPELPGRPISAPPPGSSKIYPDLPAASLETPAAATRGMSMAERDARPCAANRHAGLQDFISASAPSSPTGQPENPFLAFKVDSLELRPQSVLPTSSCTSFANPVTEYFLKPFSFRDTYQE